MSATASFPEHLIELVNRVVRVSRLMLHQIGREPTPGELAERLAMPLDEVRRLMKIAGLPIRLSAA